MQTHSSVSVNMPGLVQNVLCFLFSYYVTLVVIFLNLDYVTSVVIFLNLDWNLFTYI